MLDSDLRCLVTNDDIEWVKWMLHWSPHLEQVRVVLDGHGPGWSWAFNLAKSAWEEMKSRQTLVYQVELQHLNGTGWLTKFPQIQILDSHEGPSKSPQPFFPGQNTKPKYAIL